MEAKITENYKDIKATETAISRRMSYKAAQKLTDVARTERMELDEKTREALEARVRTKSALDAQKVAEADVMREADNIVESSKAMMEDAMKIVKPDFAAKSSSGSRSSRGEKVEWLTEENFKDRDSAEARAERLAAMSADADYQLALSEAAAEDESQRVKNVAAVQRNRPSSSEGEGEAAAQVVRSREAARRTRSSAAADLVRCRARCPTSSPATWCASAGFRRASRRTSAEFPRSGCTSTPGM